MKKAFDQTVRDLKREVNKKVLKVPGIEQKILDATSNEPWGPHGSHLADIAQATRNHPEYQMIMHVIWKRLNDTGKNWRHVYKALTVLEYLVGHGTERVIDEIREHAYQISTLSDFQYIDSSGRDQGSNVRRKSQSLVALVNDKERIQEVRQKAIANRDKFRSTHLLGGRSPYGDRYEEDRYEGRYRDSYDGRSRDSYEGRYRDSYEGRYRDEDRSGSGRDRDWGSRDDERYGRGSDSYNRDGDRFGRDSDEHYGRDSYRDNDYRGRGNDGYQFGPRSRSLDRDRDRYSEEDDRSSRNNGGRVDEPSQDDRRLERKLSGQSPPPTYEAAVKDAREHVQDGRGVENVASSATEAFSPPAAKSSIPTSTSQEPNQYATGASPSANNEGDKFDEFDPRGSMPATAAPASGPGVDLFGNQSASDSIDSLALVPVSFATTYEADVPVNSGAGTNFVPLSSASKAFGQPSEDPFGDGPFKATAQDNFQEQQQGFAPATSFQPSSIVQGAEPPAPAAPSFDFGVPLGGLTYTSAVANGRQHLAASPSPMASEFPLSQANNVALGGVPTQPFQQPAFATHRHTTNANYIPQTGPPAVLAPQPAVQPIGASNPQPAPVNYLAQPGLSFQPAQQTAPINYSAQPGLSSQPAQQTAPVNYLTQSGPSSQPALQTALAVPGQLAKAQPQKDKFETKSTVWADTLNRGLVNLNISGAKVNPLADIGVDFDAINRMDRRKEKSSAAPISSTITMGKAMGSGSGMGRAGAGGFASPSNPMMGSGMGHMGMGAAGGVGRAMGMGMGAGPGMSMVGYGGGMNQPMGMGMGMNRGMNMGMGMSMGMDPGAQMRPPAQGPGMPGVNPMMGTGMGGSYASQQPYGGGYR